MRRVAAILKLIRFPLLFTALADASVAVLLTHPGRFPWGELAGMWLAAAGLYIFGMAGNDFFDAERDRQAMREGSRGRISPVASGELSRRAALGVTIAGAMLAAFAAGLWPATINPLAVAAGLLLALAYNAGLKRVPALGLVLLGAVRSANAAQGLTNAMAAAWWLAPAIIGVHVTLISTVAYRWEGKRPLLRTSGVATVLATCTAIVVGTLTIGPGRTYGIWPVGRLWIVGAAWAAFVAIALTIVARAPRPRRGPLLILLGLSWLIVLDWSFALAAGLYRAGLLFAVLLAGVLISRRALRQPAPATLLAQPSQSTGMNGNPAGRCY